MQSAFSMQTTSAQPPPTKPGHEIIVDMLLEQGVDTVFDYSGAAVIPLYDAIYKRNLEAFKASLCGEPFNEKTDFKCDKSIVLNNYRSSS